jgi:multiple sugar transport system substrate-binding protein
MKNTRVLLCLPAIAFILLCTGCADGLGKAGTPVTLTIWHVYGEQTDSPLNRLIEEFNETEGAEKGIRIEVTSVSNTNVVHRAVLAAESGQPGAGTLPDLFVSYPKTVLAMQDSSRLVDYRDYLTEEELSDFVPSFLEEGMIDGRLVILPVAKSTEILYINKTAYDAFARATGARMEDLSTWEGLYEQAELYYQWTDALTPDIPGDGKAFFVHDYPFDYFQVGVESLGEDFFDRENLVFGSAFHEAFVPYARAAISGGLWLGNGYATEPLRTGETICSVASSAGVLYYSDVVTHEDNTSEEIELTAMPCPVFADGEKLVMQRGAGLCLVKSTAKREEAAVSFLRWLTDPSRNVDFVTRTGYMPVKTESFHYLDRAIGSLSDPKYVAMYKALLKTQGEYSYYTMPQLDSYLELEAQFEENIRQVMRDARGQYRSEEADTEVPDAVVEETFEVFRSTMRTAKPD